MSFIDPSTDTKLVNEGTIEVLGGAAVSIVGAPVVENSGTIQVVSSNLPAISTLDLSGGSIVNTGSILLQADTALSFSKTDPASSAPSLESHNGVIVVHDGAQIQAQNGGFDLHGDTVQAYGSVDVNGAVNSSETKFFAEGSGTVVNANSAWNLGAPEFHVDVNHGLSRASRFQVAGSVNIVQGTGSLYAIVEDPAVTPPSVMWPVVTGSVIPYDLVSYFIGSMTHYMNQVSTPNEILIGYSYATPSPTPYNTATPTNTPAPSPSPSPTAMATPSAFPTMNAPL
jgi:hypothetical protein